VTQLTINSDDLGLLVLCSLRYAMGRKSYITAAVADIIEARWNELSPNDKVNILRDLERSLGLAADAGQTLGMTMDDSMWRGLLERLNARVKDAKREALPIPHKNKVCLGDIWEYGTTGTKSLYQATKLLKDPDGAMLSTIYNGQVQDFGGVLIEWEQLFEHGRLIHRA
jgi:hypothetical protein